MRQCIIIQVRHRNATARPRLALLLESVEREVRLKSGAQRSVCAGEDQPTTSTQLCHTHTHTHTAQSLTHPDNSWEKASHVTAVTDCHVSDTASYVSASAGHVNDIGHVRDKASNDTAETKLAMTQQPRQRDILASNDIAVQVS